MMTVIESEFNDWDELKENILSTKDSINFIRVDVIMMCIDPQAENLKTGNFKPLNFAEIILHPSEMNETIHKFIKRVDLESKSFLSNNQGWRIEDLFLILYKIIPEEQN